MRTAIIFGLIIVAKSINQQQVNEDAIFLTITTLVAIIGDLIYFVLKLHKEQI